MCSNNENGANLLEPKPDFRLFRKCLKCDKNSIIVTRINDALCKECFMEYFVHKFRATIGKSKIFDRDEIVLFPYSASGSSVAMLNLISKGVSEEAKKKFTFKPILLYIEDNFIFDSNCSVEKRVESVKKIHKSMEYSGFKAYFSLFENCYLENSETKLYTDDPDKLEFNTQRKDSFLNLVNSLSNETSKEELLKRLKIQFINKVAKELNIKKVIFPITCTKLTIDLLTNVAIGKGAHLSTEMSFEQKHPDGFSYIRPLRELTSKECAFYNHYSGLDDFVLANSSSLLNPHNSTIYRLTEKFINGLQNDYPTTVSTIFRTSDKLSPIEDLLSEAKNCALCECALDTKTNILATSSAINDLEYSISIAKIESLANKNFTQNNKFLVNNFCYSCSVVINDLKNKNELPKSIKEKLRDEMKNQIQEFLIEDK